MSNARVNKYLLKTDMHESHLKRIMTEGDIKNLEQDMMTSGEDLVPHLKLIRLTEATQLDAVKKFLKVLYPNDWQAIKKHVGIGVLAGACLFVKSLLIQEAYFSMMSGTTSPFPNDNEMCPAETYSAWWGIIFGPIFEEFVFRGVIPTMLQDTLEVTNPELLRLLNLSPQTAGILGSGYAFSYVHHAKGPASMISTAFGGFFLQKIQMRDHGSLLGSTAAHMVHNGIAYLLGK